MKRILIAIDPGKKTGVAVFYDRKLVRAAEVESCDAIALFGIAQTDKALNQCEVIVAIEEMYMGEGKAFKSIRTLIEISGFWRLLAESHGFKTMRVNPRSWQASLKVKGQGNTRRAQCKRLSKEYAVALHGEAARAWTDNMCDAYHIGRWALAEIKIQEAK